MHLEGSRLHDVNIRLLRIHSNKDEYLEALEDYNDHMRSRCYSDSEINKYIRHFYED